MPTNSSWLNQIESWFSRPNGEVLDRSIFISVADLRRKIMRHIRLYGKTAYRFAENTPLSVNGSPHGKDSARTAHQAEYC